MPKIIIDAREIEVPKGTKVIDAAERLGIMIPRFCYHQALGAVGACRLCAVKFIEGPIKGIEMSCMENCLDGMVVSSTDPEAVLFRKYVIEWLMMNHPLDCPVCDEGGHCLLQDETISGGHGIRRYEGAKRTYYDQYIGFFVQHEMNRCIQCWRCRRFYQEFAGYNDLGAMQIGNRTYFGRFANGPLESPFAGNIIDICPTGVFTDKPARFKGRRWDFQRGPNLCIHCSLGCNTTGSVRYRAMMRQEARLNEAVNGHFICDRGRFGFHYVNNSDRPRRAVVTGKEKSYAEALEEATKKLSEINRKHGPHSIACWGSVRNSLETQAILKYICSLLGWRRPQYFTLQETAQKTKKAVGRLDSRLAVSMRDIENADLIIAAGADPVNEAPMLALAMRQAVRKGAVVTVIDPRPVTLPFDFVHLPVSTNDINNCLNALIEPSHSATDRLGEEIRAGLTGLREKASKSRQPVIICGTDIVNPATPDLAADLALSLKQIAPDAGLFYILSGPNAFGSALLSPPEAAENMLESIENGGIKALLLVENDPFWSFPNGVRLSSALEKLEFLMILDYVNSSDLKQADIVIPTAALFEQTERSFVNQEGRLQLSSPIYEGGTPVSEVSGGSHPPRVFLDHIPGETKPASYILSDLAHALTGGQTELSIDKIWKRLSEENSLFSRFFLMQQEPYGIRLIPDEVTGQPTEREIPGFETGSDFELLTVEWTFGTEELSSYSRFIQQAEKPPRILMHEADAEELGLASGQEITLELDQGDIRVEMETCAQMARRTLVLPRHRLLAWQKMAGGRIRVPFGHIKA